MPPKSRISAGCWRSSSIPKAHIAARAQTRPSSRSRELATSGGHAGIRIQRLQGAFHDQPRSLLWRRRRAFVILILLVIQVIPENEPWRERSTERVTTQIQSLWLPAIQAQLVLNRQNAVQRVFLNHCWYSGDLAKLEHVFRIRREGRT